MAMVESALGAVPMLPSVRLPGPLAERAQRVSTQRALHCVCGQAGVGQHPGVGDLGAATPVSRDRDLGEVEQLDPILRGSHPAAVAASVVSRTSFHLQAVRITLLLGLNAATAGAR